MTIFTKTVHLEAPSISAASSSSRDVVLEEVADDDHVAHSHHTGQEQCPHTAQQTRFLNDQVSRYQTAAEIHGDDEEQTDVFASGQVFDAQRICHQIDHDHRVDGADDGVLDAVHKTGEQRTVCKHSLIALQGELAGQQEGLAGVHVVGV